ncbi:Alpha-mannosidase 2C1 [Rhizoctonia solani]|uniref:Alpha-mannosidase 2C1 n=1 Tax=Rhizoctonia solani TaxID=456999 RepID=A0A0K6FPM2_9AGAM|nr:Alpha-mannosidase 2C1 [Rhizoctonia solani]
MVSLALLTLLAVSPRVLIYTATEGYRHESIETATAALFKLGQEHKIDFDHMEDRTLFNDNNLAKYDALLFLNNNDEVLDESGKQAFQRYLNKGGNYVGVHGGGACLYNTTFYQREALFLITILTFNPRPSPPAQPSSPSSQPPLDLDLDHEVEHGLPDIAQPRRGPPRQAASQCAAIQPKFRAAGRCDPCIERGPASRCNKRWPSCGKCIHFGTTDQCYGAQENQDDPDGNDRTDSRARPTIRGNSHPPLIPSRAALPAPRRSASPRRRVSTAPSIPTAPLPIDDGARHLLLQQAQEELANAQARVAALQQDAATSTYAPRLPAPVPPTPIPVTIGGLNVGQVRSTTDPLPPVAQGVLVNPEFSFVPKAVVDLFTKKNWSSHISLRYLTDEYCQQVNWHDQLRDTMHFDSGSGTWVTSSAELPDLSESLLAFVQWMRAFQRLLAILRSMSHPRTPYWEAHGHIVEHHPSLTSNWPLVLAYDIAMRRHSVLDRSLDVSIFQERVFNDLRPQFERRAMEDFVRGLYATETTRRAPAAEARTARGQLQIAAGPSSAPTRASGSSSQGKPLWCFVCGGSAHTSRTCRATAQVSGKELVTTRSADGKNWVIDAAIETISAPSAAAAPTLLALAGLDFKGSDPRIVVTPLLVQPWTVALQHAHALPKFNDLLTGIVEGFRIGVHSSLAATTIYPNHLSARSRPDIILNHIAKEVAAGRYTSPFSPDSLSLLIGHFRASPLGVVDKPSSPGKFCVIQDFSFPRSDLCSLSFNSEINPDDFCCTWGFFQDVVEIILKLPPGSEAATFDVDAAYRRMPVHPSDQNHIVVHWEGQCWIDHCVPFGAASSNGIFGCPVVKWVDDFLYFRAPSQLQPLSFGYAESDILRLGDLLGLPWKAAKTKPFANTFQYLGFDWTISQPRVTIPPEKCAKFIAKISSWLHSGPATLRSTESVLGSLIHCALAVPLGRLRVAGIARFTSSFSHAYKDRFKTRVIPDYAKEDAAWWLDILLQPNCGSSLSLPPPFIDIPCFVDASTSFGVGLHLGGRVRAWALKKGWKSAGRDIGWAEMIALELALLALAAAGYSNCSIIIHSDNQGVIGAFQTGRSRNTHQNAALQRIQSLALDRNIQVSLIYVHTDENLADAPSRGITASTDTHFPSFDLPSHLDKWLRPVK